ncbi:MAG TPA: nucleoside/nucleotide kinase family protein [Drouetiella sp.]
MVEASNQALKPVSDYANTVIEMQKTKNSRIILGITGAPAAGKSTFADDLVRAINQISNSEMAIVVPMDGFHYSNEFLTSLGLLALKGIPATFDAQGFVETIAKIKSTNEHSVFCPLFDRSIEASIQDAIEVKPQHKIVVSEGNYLLLSEAPWNKLRDLFDQIWYIDAELETLIPRLISRHEAGGRNDLQAKEKMDSTDIPNAKLIHSTRARADQQIRLY